MTAFDEIPKKQRNKVLEFLVNVSSRANRSDQQRIKRFDKVMKGIKDVSKSKLECIEDHVLINRILVQFRLGSESKNGEVDKSCYPILCTRHSSSSGSSFMTPHKTCHCQNSSISLALKKAPLFNRIPRIDPLVDDITSQEWTKYDVYAEIVCLELSTFLVKAKVCPNLPMFFTYYPCNNCDFENEEIEKYYGSKKGACILSLSEFANGGDLAHWTKKSRSFEEWMNAYFQIFMGIIAIQKYYNMVHFDLHWGNILIHEIPKGGYWEYTLDKKKYYCPNLGFLFTLWDFGYAFIPGKLVIPDVVMSSSNAEAIRDGTVWVKDYQRISAAPNWASDHNNVAIPPRMKNEFQNYIYQGWPLRYLFQVLYGPGGYFDLSQKPANSSSPLQRYCLDLNPEKVAMPSPYRKFLATQDFTNDYPGPARI